MPENAGVQVQIDDKTYTLAKSKGLPAYHEGQSIDNQEAEVGPVAEQWLNGFSGGMGETKRSSQDGYAFSKNWDASSYGILRLSPARIEVTPDFAPVDKPTFFFEESPSGDASIITGTFTKSVTPGATTQTVTHGLNVIPKAIIMWTAGKSASGTVSAGFRASMGFAYGPGTADGYSISVNSEDNVATSNTIKAFKQTIVELTPLSGSGPSATTNPTTWTTTTLDLSWSSNDAVADIIHFIAIGGEDVSAKAVTWVPAGVPYSHVTGVGFQPDAVIHISNGLSLGTGGSHANFNIGVMESDANQWSIAVQSRDAVNPSSSNRVAQNGKCITHLDPSTGAQSYHAAFAAMTTDGFVVNNTLMTTQPRIASLCLQGVRVRAGLLDKSAGAGGGSQAVTAVGFQPTGLMAASIWGGSGTTNMRFGMGAATSTSTENTMTFVDADGITPTNTNGVDYNAASNVLLSKIDNNAATPTVEATASLTSFDTDGFTLSWSADSGGSLTPRVFFLAFAALDRSASFVYGLNGQRSTKMSVSSNVITVQEQKDFGSNAQAGHPSKFGATGYNARWHIPTGALNNFWRLTTVQAAGTPDTWAQDASLTSLAFATTVQGATAALVRAHTGFKIDLSTDGTTFGGDTDVGESSTNITSMEDSGNVLFVAKEDNLYEFDATGTSRQLTRYQKGDKSSNHGVGLLAISGSEVCYYNHKALVFWSGQQAAPVGPDSIKENQAIPNVTHEPFRGEHLESCFASDQWQYSLYQVIESSVVTYIDAIDHSRGWKHHTFMRFEGVARGLFVDSGHRLWFANVAEGKWGYVQLGADGSPDSGRDNLGYGVTGEHIHYLPRTTFGVDHTLKQLRDVEVKTLNVSADTPIQIKALRDFGAEEDVGAVVETTGVTERFFDLTDTCYDLMLALSITGGPLQMIQGTYEGDGTTGRPIAGLGFQPKLVVVKANHATNSTAMLRSSTMSAARNFSTTTTDQGIASLDSDGFTVDHVASSTGRTNESGKTYYWWAIGGDNVETGTYIGDGLDNHAVTGVGFLPALLFTSRAGDSSVIHRHSAMGASDYSFDTDGGQTDRTKTLTSDGFTLGTDNEVNQNGITYDYIAVRASANLHLGVYTGDNADSRDLPATAMAFDPDIITIKAGAGPIAVWKVASLAGDASLEYSNGAAAANLIQSLTPADGKFQVGTDSQVNSSSGVATYYFFAMKAIGEGLGVTTDPQVLSVIVRAMLRPKFARQVKIVVDTALQLANEAEQQRIPSEIRSDLFALEKTVATHTDLNDNVFKLFVQKVSDEAVTAIDETVHYQIALDCIRWVDA